MTWRLSFMRRRRGLKGRQPALASGGAGGANDRKIDISLRDHVEQVGEDVLGGNSEDLHDLAIAEAGIADRLDGDVSTLAHDPGCETHGGIRLRVTGRTLAIE